MVELKLLKGVMQGIEIIISKNRDPHLTHVYNKSGGSLHGVGTKAKVDKYFGKTNVYTLEDSEGKRLLFRVVFWPLSIGGSAKDKFEDLRELLS
jgi:hypothetical protein